MNDDTLLYRQVHPSFIVQGNVSRQAFHPTPKDNGSLSVYDGDKIDPEAAWNHYHSNGLASAGVLGVSVAECNDLELPVRPDPAPFPEHVVIDFTGLKRGKTRQKAGRLRAAANERGWLFRV